MTYAASVEQNSAHVLAAAITRAAADRQLRLFKAKHAKEVAGFGLEAHISGKAVLIGRFALLHDHGIKIPKEMNSRTFSQTATLVAIDGQLAGYITFTDNLRSDAAATLEQLRRYGAKHTLMVTGDNRAVAESIAEKLGITDIYAEALPGDKLRAIEALSDRPVAFIGDGINDAPVLTLADVGIALGARGSTAASESADIVILRDSLALVARAAAIAHRSFRIATESIIIGIGLSIILMLVFATGKFPPLYGAIIQEFVDIIVIFNALRAHRMPVRKVKLKQRMVLQKA